VAGEAKSGYAGALRWTLRRGLILIVMAAMAPVVLVSFLQAQAALIDMRSLVDARIVATARAIAERERTTFIIAQHLLTVASQDPAIRDMRGDCRAALVRLFPAGSAIRNLGRLDAAGHPRCTVIPSDPRVSFAREGWWIEAVRQSSFSISAPMMAPVAQTRVLSMFLPVRNAAGQQDGIVGAALSLDAIQASINNAEISDGAMVALVSHTGDTILTRGGNAFSLPVKGRTIYASMVARAAGEEWIYALAPLQDRNLFILYAEPRQAVMSVANSNIRAGIVLPLVAIALAAMAVWFGVDRFVVRWLQSLQRLAKEFATGNFAGAPAEFAGAPVEVEALSGDMHAMASAIAERDRALTEALEAQKRLTREVHHRVKNNLQIVVSLLAMQGTRLADRPEAAALHQTRARVGALALIHRLMYEEDTSAEVGEVGLADLLGELCRQLRTTYRTHSAATLECETAPHAIAADLAVPIAMFVVEAVSNAYRHAFDLASPGSIVLSFATEEGRGLLEIADDGRGYSPATVDSMGTELMRGFATQLNGAFNVETQPGAGTRVKLDFPLEPFAR